MSERKRFEGRLQYLADHDSMTGLINRRRFEQELSHAHGMALRYQEAGALLVIDLDNFKAVNDAHGHGVGDALIGRVAGVMRDRVRDTDILARLGGDEFAVILPKCDAGAALNLAEELVAAVAADAVVTVDERELHTTASAGVAPIGPATHAAAADLLVEAELAMFEAKQSGRSRVALADSSCGGQAKLRAGMRWGDRIEHALEAGGLALMAQPILDLVSGSVGGYELLLRMRGEDGKLVLPGLFVPTAERTGQILALDRWVVSRAVALLAERQRRGQDDMLEVNLSGVTLTDPQAMEAIIRAVADADADATRLVIEVTETAAIANIERARNFAAELASLGCRFALDDFGAGFGSFYYLKHLPFDRVKIDGELIRDLPADRSDQLAVRAIAEMVAGLGKQTVGEFVEDEATLLLLREFGVHHAQGHYVGRPVPVASLPVG